MKKKKLIIETLGVPENIISVAIELTNLIIDEIKQKLTPNKYNYNIIIDPPYNFKISDLIINDIKLSLVINKDDFFEKVTLVSYAMISKSQKLSLNKPVLHTSNENNITADLSLVIGVPLSYNNPQDIINELETNKISVVKSIAHELKHVYDRFKGNIISMESQSKYESISGLSTTIPTINKFLFMLYYTHNYENLVRPVEVATSINVDNITKKDFLKFLQKNNVYKELKEIQSFNVSDFIHQLHNEMPKIEEFFNLIDIDYNNMTDQEKINKLLYIIYVTISNRTLEIFKSYISPNPLESFIESFMNKDIHEMKIQWLIKLSNKLYKFEKNPIKFYDYCEKMFKFTSTKLIKKLSKLYAMTKDTKNNNSIIDYKGHSKINNLEEKTIKYIKKNVTNKKNHT